MCDANKKFLLHVLKSSDVLDILVPILYHLNDSRADQSRLGLMHIAVSLKSNSYVWSDVISCFQLQ